MSEANGAKIMGDINTDRLRQTSPETSSVIFADGNNHEKIKQNKTNKPKILRRDVTPLEKVINFTIRGKIRYISRDGGRTWEKESY